MFDAIARISNVKHGYFRKPVTPPQTQKRIVIEEAPIALFAIRFHIVDVAQQTHCPPASL
jgi:hypothetical protein